MVNGSWWNPAIKFGRWKTFDNRSLTISLTVFSPYSSRFSLIAHIKHCKYRRLVYLEYSSPKSPLMAGKAISVADANLMIAEYASFMHGLGVSMATQTQDVAFTGSALSTWLGNVMPYADELRIFMGVYPLGNPRAGRTTVIIWPYKNGVPATDGGFRGGNAIEPFNDGMGNP
jgi:hypothetical protein